MSSRISFLYSSSGGDARVLELLEGPRAGVGHREAGLLECPQQLGRRIGVERRGPQRRADLAQQPLEHRGAPTGSRARAEQVGEQALVHVRPPRQAGVRHLGGHQGAGGLRREQQREPVAVR
ncbi:hypothetical protein [Blastococcus sp. SYSU DS0828]